MNPLFRNAVLSSLFAVLLAQGASSAALDDPQQPLDEVTIRGKRSLLEEMRQKFTQVQDRLFARYNELNTKREFEMHCAAVMSTGTRIGGKRACTAVFEDEGTQLEGQLSFEHLQPIQDQHAAGKQPIALNGTPAPASMTIEARRPEFREHWRKLASSDPELIRLLRERSELLDRYDALRREIFDLEPRPARKDAATAPTR